MCTSSGEKMALAYIITQSSDFGDSPQHNHHHHSPIPAPPSLHPSLPHHGAQLQSYGKTCCCCCSVPFYRSFEQPRNHAGAHSNLGSVIYCVVIFIIISRHKGLIHRFSASCLFMLADIFHVMMFI